MPAGDLRERVSLVRKTLTDDGSGGATASESTYATVWAEVRPMSGREREQAMRQEATSNYLVRIRHRTDVVEGDIVRWGSRDLNVRFVRNAGAKPQYLDIEAELGAAS
jgi:SPP1 family predicted phage head-tail adaptor